MTLDEFKLHFVTLNGSSFEIYPVPEGIEHNEFKLIDYNPTHLKIVNTKSVMERHLSLSAIELINPGIVRTYRHMKAYGQSFV